MAVGKFEGLNQPMVKQNIILKQEQVIRDAIGAQRAKSHVGQTYIARTDGQSSPLSAFKSSLPHFF